jgi:hypothetical protein
MSYAIYIIYVIFIDNIRYGGAPRSPVVPSAAYNNMTIIATATGLQDSSDKQDARLNDKSIAQTAAVAAREATVSLVSPLIREQPPQHQYQEGQVNQLNDSNSSSPFPPPPPRRPSLLTHPSVAPYVPSPPVTARVTDSKNISIHHVASHSNDNDVSSATFHSMHSSSSSSFAAAAAAAAPPAAVASDNLFSSSNSSFYSSTHEDLTNITPPAAAVAPASINVNSPRLNLLQAIKVTSSN